MGTDQVTTTEIDEDELMILKKLALSGPSTEELTTSCTELADELAVSRQTVSRRLQRLEAVGHIEREVSGDGQKVILTGVGERRLFDEFQDYQRIFGGENIVTFEGNVTSGMGEGQHYISLTGYTEQFENRLGYTPFPGTLNIELAESATHQLRRLERCEKIHIDGWQDDDRTYGPATCHPATLHRQEGTDTATKPAHVLRPERTHHEDEIMELIAPVELREALDLDDGETVTIEVEAEP